MKNLKRFDFTKLKKYNVHKRTAYIYDGEISVQIPKEQVKKDIMAAAREEFLAKGYEKASIRAITSKARTSTTNVYNYFKDKDALFGAVLEPTLSGINSGLEDIRLQNREKQAGYSLRAQKDVMARFIDYIFDHKEDFELLLFHSSGSSLSNFKNEVIRELAVVLEDWIRYAAPDKKHSEYIYSFRCWFLRQHNRKHSFRRKDKGTGCRELRCVFKIHLRRMECGSLNCRVSLLGGSTNEYNKESTAYYIMHFGYAFFIWK